MNRHEQEGDRPARPLYRPPMNEEDYASRWHRALWGGKSKLQRDLERELAQRRAQNPAPKRAPLTWYWWVAIAVGLGVWTALAFSLYDFSL